MSQDPIAGFIADQPAVLDATLAATREFAARWHAPRRDGIALVGAGSSFNALATALPLFARAHRGPVALHGPADFLRDLSDGAIQAGLVVALSQSGASATTVADAEAALAQGIAVVAITADGTSPLARSGAALLQLPIGAEPVGPKTKGFLASVAALFALAEALGGPQLPSITGNDLRVLLDPAWAAAHALATQLAEADALLLAGDGALHGIALEGSLKIAEIAGLPCAAWTLEEALHSRLHGLTANSQALLLAGDAATRRHCAGVVEAMRRRNARVAVLNPGGAPWTADWPSGYGGLPGPWLALAALLPLQCLAVALAEARGLPPHRMRYPGLSADLGLRLAPGAGPSAGAGSMSRPQAEESGQ